MQDTTPETVNASTNGAAVDHGDTPGYAFPPPGPDPFGDAPGAAISTGVGALEQFNRSDAARVAAIGRQAAAVERANEINAARLDLYKREVVAREATAGAFVRLANMHADVAQSLDRLARVVPFFSDDKQRWMYRLADIAVAQRPKQPEKIDDLRARCAILAAGLAERFVYWVLPEEERERIKREREAAKAADAAGGGAPSAGAEGGF